MAKIPAGTVRLRQGEFLQRIALVERKAEGLLWRTLLENKETSVHWKWKLWTEVFGSSVAVGVAWIASWWAIYSLKSVMERITALEEHVSMSTPSFASARVMFLEMAAADFVLMAFVVAYLLLPVFWGWWIARTEAGDAPAREKAAVFLASLVIPLVIGVGALCFLFSSAQWARNTCTLFLGRRGLTMWVGIPVLTPVSRELWKSHLGIAEREPGGGEHEGQRGVH